MLISNQELVVLHKSVEFQGNSNMSVVCKNQLQKGTCNARKCRWQIINIHVLKTPSVPCGLSRAVTSGYAGYAARTGPPLP